MPRRPRRIKKSRSKRLFSRTAARVNRRNNPRSPIMRGGIRL